VVLRLPGRKLTVVSLTNYHPFYPLLSEAILDTRLPPRPPSVCLPDSAPQVTAKLLGLLASAQKGSVDTGPFSEKARAEPHNTGMASGRVA
jgi:hypothetical protein